MEYIIFDVETWKSHSFAFGVVCYPEREEYLVFNKAEEIKQYFLSLVRKDRKTKYKFMIIGHNISYDLNWIFGNFELFFAPKFKKEGRQKRKRFHIDYLARGGRFYYAKYYNLNFIDTFNLFPLSLEKAGKVVDFSKLNMDSKFMQKTPCKITKEDIEYCKRDCIVTWKIYNKIKDWIFKKGGELKHTVASSGLTVLKHKNPNFKKYLKEMNSNWRLSELDELFRLAFFGGRVEVFIKMIIDGYYYDVNSLYPSVMHYDNFYPDPMTLRYFHSDLEKALELFEGCANIEIEIPKMKIPPLPTKRDDGKIIYPTGKIKGVWNFPEIRLALEMGCKIINTEWIVIGDRIESPWADYVDELYNERKFLKSAGNYCLIKGKQIKEWIYDLKTKKGKIDPTEEVIKIYMNALYGKFSQKAFQDKFMKIDDCDESGECFFIDEQWIIRVNTEPERARCDLLCLASYVTSLARVKIYRYYIKCGFNLAYTDTDSLVTPIKLEDSKELGKMKLEHKVKYASFKGRKDYILILEDKAVIRRKGVSIKSLSKIKTDDKVIEITDEILKKLKDGDIEICKKVHESDFVVYEKILKARESIRRKLNAGHSIEQEKNRLKTEDDGRIWEDTVSIPIHNS